MKRIASPWFLAVLPAGVLLWAGISGADPQRVSAVSRADALQAFDTVQKVLQHPRCQNCHIPGDAPLQFDEGIIHAQNVLRGPEGKGVPGLPCSSC
ncbi:MAG TPA: hypothetical protein VF414_07985, partial [Thermoanaerobaculia bacterium]